jgi:translocation and assembly module TamB
MRGQVKSKRLFRWLIVGFIAALATIVCLFLLLQTAPVKGRLSAWLSSVSSSVTHRRVQFGRLEGLIPLHMQFDRITLSDDRGEWLSLRNVSVNWSPSGLLRGRIQFSGIEADTVRLSRLPEKQEKRKSSEHELSELLKRPPPVTIDHLAIPDLFVGAEVTGQEAVFRLEARLFTEGSMGALTTALSVSRMDKNGPPTEIDLEAIVTPSSTAMSLRASLNEGAGGWIASALGLKAAGALSLSLNGAGPLGAWKGELDGSSGKYGSLNSKIGLRYQKEITLNLEGEYRAGKSLIPADWTPLLGEGTVFGLDMSYQTKESLLIKKLTLRGDGYQALIEGQLNLKSHKMEGRFSLSMDDLGVLKQIAGAPLSGGLTAAGSVAGPWKEPLGSISVDLRKVVALDLRADTASIQLRFNPAGVSTSGFSGYRVTGNGKAAGLASPEKKPFPMKSLELVLDAQVLPKGKITLDKLSLIGDRDRLDLKGDFDTRSTVGELDAAVRINDLRPLTGYLGGEFPGSAEMEAQLKGDARSRSGTFVLQGRVSPSENSSSRIAVLAGPGTTIALNGELRNGNQLSVSSLRLDSPIFRFSSHGSLNLVDKNLKAGWRMDIPRLQPLSGVVGQPLAGSLQARGELTGPVGSLAATATVAADSLVLRNAELQKVSLTLKARDIPSAPKGDIRMELVTKEASGALATGFSYERPRVALSGLSLTTPGNRIDGSMAIDLKSRLLSGRLTGKLNDLAVVGRLAGEKMAGSAALQAEFSPGKEGQHADISAEGNGIALPLGKIGKFALSAHLKYEKGFPAGKADLQIQGASTERSGIVLERLSLNASGDKGAIAFQGSMKGEAKAKFDLAVRGDAARTPVAEWLRIRSLNGHVDQYALGLTRPSTIQKSGEKYSLDGFPISFGPGKLNAEGSLDPKRVALDVSFERIPLAALGLVKRLPTGQINGFATGKLQLGGELAKPSASARLDLSELHPPGPSFKALPPATLHAEGKYENGELSADLNIEGITKTPAHADISVPANLSLRPVSFSIPPEGALNGHLHADADLLALSTFFPVVGQKIAGHAVVNLDVGGRMSAPALNGSIAVRNGVFENFGSGLVLTNMEINVQAEGNRLEISTFRASDGGRGIITAVGSVDLDAKTGYPVRMDIDLSNATLVRRDDITAAIAGKVEVKGPIRSAALKGKLTLSPAHVTLPQRLPPEMKELPVVEINGQGQLPPVSSKSELKAPVRLVLDLEVSLPNRIFVRGWGLDSEWAGHLRVSGTTEKPIVTGSLSPIRGSFEFVNKRFNLTQGSISFQGSTPPAPYIDITAESQAQNLTVRLHFTGYTSHLKIALESDPPLPSDEILSQLMFGKSKTSISPTQALRLVSAINALTGSTAGNLNFVDRIRKFLGLDTLEFKEAQGAGFGQGVISVGKYLTDNIFLTVEKGVGQQTNKATAEVEVSPHLYIDSEVGTNAQGGLGLSWKYDY